MQTPVPSVPSGRARAQTGKEPGGGYEFIEGNRGESALAAHCLLDPVQVAADVDVDARFLGLPTGV